MLAKKQKHSSTRAIVQNLKVILTELDITVLSKILWLAIQNK